MALGIFVGYTLGALLGIKEDIIRGLLGYTLVLSLGIDEEVIGLLLERIEGTDVALIVGTIDCSAVGSFVGFGLGVLLG